MSPEAWAPTAQIYALWIQIDKYISVFRYVSETPDIQKSNNWIHIDSLCIQKL